MILTRLGCSVSYEQPLNQSHNIIENGYNLGRDWLVGNATQHTFLDPNPLQSVPTPTADVNATHYADGGSGIIATVANGQYTGTSSANNYTYQTIATYMTGLLGNTSIGVSHNDTITVPGGLPAMDGLVAVLVVSVLSKPNSTA